MDISTSILMEVEYKESCRIIHQSDCSHRGYHFLYVNSPYVVSHAPNSVSPHFPLQDILAEVLGCLCFSRPWYLNLLSCARVCCSEYKIGGLCQRKSQTGLRLSCSHRHMCMEGVC